MYFILQFINNKIYNLLFLFKIFLLEIFFNDYNLMKNYNYTLVPNKSNMFKGKKFFLTNLPFNLKNTQKFEFHKKVNITKNINNKSKNNILILDVTNLNIFSCKYLNYDQYNIFFKLDIFKLKKDFGGIFIVNQNFNKNLFDFKYLWFFSENNFSGYIFNYNLINTQL